MMADLLEGGDLSEEAGEALREATFWAGRTPRAWKTGYRKPAEMKESLRPPLPLLWRDALPTVHELASNASLSLNRVTEVLQKLLE
jgi:hypothetical protein